MKLLVGMIVLGLGIGCVTTDSQADLVAQRAVFDLQCRRDQLQISSLGQNTFGAVGCGQRAAYSLICRDVYIDDCTAILNTTGVPANAIPGAK